MLLMIGFNVRTVQAETQSTESGEQKEDDVVTQGTKGVAQTRSSSTVKFDDVDDEETLEALNYILQFGELHGCENNEFRLNDYITYAEAIEMIALVDGYDKETENVKEFLMKNDEHWCAKYLNIAYIKGILGYKYYPSVYSSEIYRYIDKADGWGYLDALLINSLGLEYFVYNGESASSLMRQLGIKYTSSYYTRQKFVKTLYLLKNTDVSELLNEIPKELEIPSIYKDYYYSYNGNDQILRLEGFYPSLMNIKGNVQKNAGAYKVTISLKDTEKYVWKIYNEDTGEYSYTNEPVVISWIINKREIREYNYFLEEIGKYSHGYLYKGYEFSPIDVERYEKDKEIINISGETKAKDVGHYEVIFSLKDKNYCWDDGKITDLNVSWWISENELPYPTQFVNSNFYNGEEQTVDLNGFNETFMYLSGDYKATEIGKYQAIVGIKEEHKDGCYWEKPYQAKSELIIDWEIRQPVFEIPTAKAKSFEYDGTSKSLELNYFNSDAMTLSGDTAAIDIGEYNTEIYLKDDNYVWSDGTTDFKSINWEIVKKKFKVPQINQESFSYDAEDVNVIEYLDRYDDSYMTISGDSVKREPGKYTAYIALKDKEKFSWSDGTTDDICINWKIVQKVVIAPQITKDLTYNGKVQTPMFLFYKDKGTKVGLSDWEYISNSLDYNAVGTLEATKPGQYKITFSLKDKKAVWKIRNGNKNEFEYTSEDQVINWKIKKAPIKLNIYGSHKNDRTGRYEVEYSGKNLIKSNIIWISTNYYHDNDLISITGCENAIELGTYKCRATLLCNTELYEWEDGNSKDYDFEIEIIKCKIDTKWINAATKKIFEYTGEKINILDHLKARGKFGGVVDINKAFTFENYEAVNTGDYTLKMKIKDAKHYEFDTGKDSFEIDWKINGHNLYVVYTSAQRRLEYTGEEQNILNSIKILNMPNDKSISDLFTVSGDYIATDVGGYTFELILKEPEKYGFYNTNEYKLGMYWEINPKKIDFPIDGTTLIYNGRKQNVTLEYFDSRFMNISGDVSGTEIGEYTTIISLKNPNNCCWSNGKTYDLAVKWYISDKLPIPASKSYTYNGYLQELRPLFYNSDYMELDNEVQRNVGIYKVKVSIKDSSGITWSDSTTKPKYVYVYMDPIKPEIRISNPNIELVQIGETYGEGLVLRRKLPIKFKSTPAIDSLEKRVEIRDFYKIDGTNMYSEWTDFPEETGAYEVGMYFKSNDRNYDSMDFEDYIYVSYPNETDDSSSTGTGNSGTGNSGSGTGNSSSGTGSSSTGTGNSSTGSGTSSSGNTGTGGSSSSGGGSSSSSGGSSFGGGGGGGGSASTSYRMTVNAGNGGKIEPNGIVKVEKGESQLFEFIPNKGYIVKNVIIDGKSIGAVDSYLLENASEKHTIKVEFMKGEKAEVAPTTSGDNTKTSTSGDIIPSGDLIASGDISGAAIPSGDSIKKFNDVSENDWYSDAVSYVVNKNLFNGTSENTFSPNENMNRAMMVTVLHRIADTKLVNNSQNQFTDIKSGEYYSDAVQWAVSEGIVNGTSDSSFDPLNNITREQVVTMLYRYAKSINPALEIKNTNMTFNDKDQISEYAKDAVMWAFENGIINGKGNEMFAPNELATRAEVATMIMRFCEYINK